VKDTSLPSVKDTSLPSVKDTSLPSVKDTLLSKSEGKYGVMMTCHNTTTVLRKESTKVELLETLHYNNGNCQS
jgi:hypothetical protein